VQELESGSGSIAGASTGVAAFVGATPSGLVDFPIRVFSIGEARNNFGESRDYPLLNAVEDFFNNGAGEAVILRLYRAPTGSDGVARLKLDDMSLRALAPGKYGNGLSATVIASPAGSPGFGLRLKLGTLIEEFHGLGFKDELHRIDRVLADQSKLARWDGIEPAAGSALPRVGTAAVARGGADGAALQVSDYVPSDRHGGMYALNSAASFNQLCLPPQTWDADTDPRVYQAAESYCEARRAFLIVDPPIAWTSVDKAIAGLPALGLAQTSYAALYFPRLVDSLDSSRSSVPCGAIAGIIAATDRARGVWKAPAGISAGLNGKASVAINDTENAKLNALGINAIRQFPAYGTVVWGARTLATDQGGDYKYVPVRRLALYLENCLNQGLKWTAFEPNDEATWSMIRLSVGTFLADLARQGAFYGYAIQCGAKTSTQQDIDLGIINLIVEFAPVKPAEFVVFQMQLQAEPPQASNAPARQP
jgi:hypothetical protein